jgi:hypothetical protein
VWSFDDGTVSKASGKRLSRISKQESCQLGSARASKAQFQLGQTRSQIGMACRHACVPESVQKKPLKFFVPVCNHTNKGTRFEKRKRVCGRVEIRRGTGGFNCRRREQYSAATDHVDWRHSGNASHRLRTATPLRSTQSYVNCGQRRARGSATYLCAGRRDSTAQGERSRRFAWPGRRLSGPTDIA